jgi:thiamine transport system ATP-binding protein
VMRAGEVVQSGPIGAVWAAPVDEATALFLGYARVLVGAAARRLLAAAGLPGAGSVALRRSALVAGEGDLVGTVVSARATPELVRLVVTVEALGELDAVASLGSHVAPGETVRLRVDPTRVATIT